MLTFPQLTQTEQSAFAFQCSHFLFFRHERSMTEPEPIKRPDKIQQKIR